MYMSFLFILMKLWVRVNQIGDWIFGFGMTKSDDGTPWIIIEQKGEFSTLSTLMSNS